MRDEIANLVHPVLIYGVDLKERLDRGEDPNLESEQAQLASFDVGIMPLWDSVWTRGKCGYKILQYMGVGTPVVASDVGVNPEIIASGQNGFLARTQDDWIEGIGSLVEDAGRRKEFGLRGRQLVESNYSLDHFVEGYARVLAQVANG